MNKLLALMLFSAIASHNAHATEEEPIPSLPTFPQSVLDKYGYGSDWNKIISTKTVSPDAEFLKSVENSNCPSVALWENSKQGKELRQRVTAKKSATSLIQEGIATYGPKAQYQWTVKEHSCILTITASK